MNAHTFRLALFDPSTLRAGDYWTWYDKDLPPSDLNRCYYDSLCHHLPQTAELQRLGENDIWGGYVHFRQWVVVYRYFHGGYDTQGRPGRYIILTAWIPRDEIRSVTALRDILTSVYFQRYADSIPPRPVPEPGSLTVTLQSNSSLVEPSHPVEPTHYLGEDTFSTGLHDFLRFAGDAFLKIQKTTDQYGGKLEILRYPELEYNDEDEDGDTDDDSNDDSNVDNDDIPPPPDLRTKTIQFMKKHMKKLLLSALVVIGGCVLFLKGCVFTPDADFDTAILRARIHEMTRDLDSVDAGKMKKRDFLQKYPEIKDWLEKQGEPEKQDATPPKPDSP